ncbi:MAG: type IV pilus modification PilV family protein [Desulfosudaceae bacterium]
MLPKRSRQDAGFTLIEILVALALLAIVFTAVFRLFSQTITMDATTRFYTTAPLLAQKIMTETVTLPTARRYDNTGEFENYPGYRWQTTVTETAPGLFDSSVGDLQRVEVTVTWSANNQHFTLRRYVLPEQP